MEYVRRKAFSRQDRFDSLSAANQWLAKRCEQLNATNPQIRERYSHEQEHLYAARAAFDCCRMESARVDKYAVPRWLLSW